MRRALIAIAAGLALADAAVVILALPPLLIELDTTVEGVAAVIGVYTAVLALALPVSAALHSRATGGAGALLFAAASIGCASSNSLELLLVMRALQALGASALLAAAFDALDGGGAGRRLWVGAAVVGTAAGPALGGALTELFDWRAIFVAQAPIALAAAPALLASPIATVHEALPRPPRDVLAAAALALLSGALTAVVFLLVLLLISGWSVEPLAAAAAVTMLPLAAVGGSFVHGAAGARALAGCLLVAGGIAGLAFLPEASAWWTLLPQLLAGFGLGMAFPALAGELLHERTRAQAAALLSLRHLGITAALALLAPIVATELDDQVQLARERGTALVLDAALPPTDKIDLARACSPNLETDDPRDALTQALARERKRVTTGDRDLLSRLQRLDHQLGGGGALMDRLEQLEDQYGSTLGEAARGLDRLLGGDNAQGLLDDLQRRRRRRHVAQAARRRDRQARGRPRRRGAGGGRRGVQPGLRRDRRRWRCWRRCCCCSASAARTPGARPAARGADRRGGGAGAARAGRLRDRRVEPRARAGPDRRPVQGPRAALGRRRRGRGGGDRPARPRPGRLPLRLLTRGAGARAVRRPVAARLRARARRRPAPLDAVLKGIVGL